MMFTFFIIHHGVPAFNAVTQSAPPLPMPPCQWPHVSASGYWVSCLRNGVTRQGETPPETHLGNMPEQSLFIMWCILEQGTAHYVHNSLVTFVKTWIRMGANDPHEINGTIKKKNPPFTRAWQDPLALINLKTTDNQSRGAIKPCVSVCVCVALDSKDVISRQVCLLLNIILSTGWLPRDHKCITLPTRMSQAQTSWGHSIRTRPLQLCSKHWKGQSKKPNRWYYLWFQCFLIGTNLFSKKNWLNSHFKPPNHSDPLQTSSVCLPVCSWDAHSPLSAALSKHNPISRQQTTVP